MASRAASTTAAIDLTWTPPHIRDIATGVRYGPWFLYPGGWTGEFEDVIRLDVGPDCRPGPACSQTGAASGAADSPWPSYNTAEVRRLHPLWREPGLPTGWRLTRAAAPGDWWLYTRYADERGFVGAEIVLTQPWWSPLNYEFHGRSEARLIDGRPALLSYDLENDRSSTLVIIFDEATGAKVWVRAVGRAIRNDLEAVIAIAQDLITALGARP